MTMKELRKGDFFTLRAIEDPAPSQVYIRGEYDRTERKYWAQKFSDISDGKYIDGNREVYINFEF